METLLLTGTIAPGAQTELYTTHNPLIREKRYISGILFYLINSNFTNIVFCENSNSSLKYIDELNFIADIYGKSFEYITFKGDHKAVAKYHYGYGEAEIIDYAIDNSSFLNTDISRYKITGRYIYPFINITIQELEKTSDYFLNGLHHHGIFSVQTAFFKTSTSFYKKNLYGKSQDFYETYKNSKSINLEQLRYLFLRDYLFQLTKAEKTTIIPYATIHKDRVNILTYIRKKIGILEFGKIIKYLDFILYKYKRIHKFSQINSMKFITLHSVYALDKGFFNRDFGQIGFTLQENFGFLSEVWCLKIRDQKNFDIQGQSWKGFKNIFVLFLNLFKEAKNIDLLHMYHICRFSLLGSIIYRLRNPKGKIYIKMDMPLIIGNIDNRKQLEKIPKNLMILFLKLVNYIGFEDKRLQDFMKDLYPIYSDKFILTTSGAVNISSFVGNLKKENIISLCGRFGNEIKNYELFFDAIEHNDENILDGWKVFLIGSYTDEFSKRLDLLISQKSHFKDIIKKVGFLEQKEELYEYLSKTKILLNTSNHEGDPNFQYDAMFCGCYIVSTDVANIQQNYPEDYSIFYNIKDEIGLYNSLKQGIEINNTLQEQDYVNIQNYCLENFTWEKSLKELTDRLGNSQ